MNFEKMNLEKKVPPTSNQIPTQPQAEFNAYQSTVPATALTANQNYPATSLNAAQENSLISYNHITYALYAIGYFTGGLTAIIPIVMNYVKRDEARGTWLYSHFDWQIKTFWYSLFFWVVGLVMVVFGFSGLFIGAMVNSHGTMGGSTIIGTLGGILMGVTLLWHIYRLIRGWIALGNRQSIG